MFWQQMGVGQTALAGHVHHVTYTSIVANFFVFTSSFTYDDLCAETSVAECSEGQSV